MSQSKEPSISRLFIKNRNRQRRLFFNSIFFLGFSLSFTFSQSSNFNRDTFYFNYETYYLGSEIKDTQELHWTGNVSNCQAGIISTQAKEKIIKRVYYFRKLVGIDSKIDLIDSWSSWCQEAALIMKANNSLNHYPPSNSKCYTDGGAIAARQSNLSLGSFGSNSIDNQIKDFGANNYGVGHRRWILYPSLEGFAVGSTDRSMVLMHDGSYKDPIPYPDFISYPSPGYFPKSLIFNNLRWSFSKKDADFSKVKIEILDESNRIIPFTLEADDKFLPVDNTIVFIPQIGTINFGRDYLFSISIKNVLVAGVMKSFDYKVLLIDPYANITTIIKEPDCTKSNGTIKLTSNLGYKSIKWNNGVTGKDSITNLSAGKYTVTITDKFDNQITREIVLNNKSSNPPKFTYTCDSILCKYDTSCRIKLGNGFKSYLWNTGETKSDIIISTNSNYFVTVTDVNNCQFILKSRPTNILDSHTELIPGNPPIIKAYPSGCKYIWYFWSMGKAYKIDAYDEYQEIPTFYGDGLYSVDIKCGDKICSEYVNVIKSNTNNTELEDIIVSPNPTTGELYINTRAEITTTEIKLFHFDGTNILTEKFHNNPNVKLEIIGPSGIYFLYINAGNKVLIKKIIKL